MTTIAQISDVHVRPVGVLYNNVADSNAMLSRALSHLNRLRPRPDFVLIPGDLTDEDSLDEYAALRGILSELELPFRVMPGNHDNRENLRRAFDDHSYLPSSGPLHFTHDVGAVRIVALDTTVPGKHYGELDDAGSRG